MSKLPSKDTKEQFVREMFNNIAERYDLMNTLMSMGLDKSWRKLVVKISGIQPGGKGLDVCCGTGMLTMELARMAGSQGNIVGLDFSENMLENAKKNTLQFNLKENIRFMQGNAMDLPFEDNTFDCATVGWGLRNVPDIMGALSEMVRVVKPGSKVVSLDMAQPEAPVFKQAYWLFFEKVIPAMGRFFAGDKKAYTYLHHSAKVFPHQKILTEMFAQAGLTETRYRNLSGGVVAIVEGKKPL